MSCMNGSACQRHTSKTFLKSFFNCSNLLNMQKIMAHTQLYMCSSKKDIKIFFKGLSVFCDLKNARSSLRFGRRGLEMLFEICV